MYNKKRFHQECPLNVPSERKNHHKKTLRTLGIYGNETVREKPLGSKWLMGRFPKRLLQRVLLGILPSFLQELVLEFQKRPVNWEIPHPKILFHVLFNDFIGALHTIIAVKIRKLRTPPVPKVEAPPSLSVCTAYTKFRPVQLVVRNALLPSDNQRKNPE